MARLGTRVVFERAHFQVIATEWRRDMHWSTSRAESPCAIIELLECGSFVQQRRTGRECVDRNGIAYFNPGEHFQIEHPLGTENAGLWIQIHTDWWEEAGRELGVRARDPHLPFSRSQAISTFAADVARRHLAQRLENDDSSEALGLEEALLDVVLHALDAHEGSLPSRCAPRRVSTRLTQRVEAARLFLAENYRRKLSLADVATEVGGSPYPLCRAFLALTGRSLHRHVVSLRLRGALDALEEGCGDLTQLALRFGFASHAHFTTSFRAAYGVPPSLARRRR